MAHSQLAGNPEFEGKWKELDGIANPIISAITVDPARIGEQLMQSREWREDVLALRELSDVARALTEFERLGVGEVAAPIVAGSPGSLGAEGRGAALLTSP